MFAWANARPDKVAMVCNGVTFTYRVMAERVAGTRAALVSQGLAGPGVAALAAHDPADFWIKALALRSLGITTIALPKPEVLDELAPPGLRWVIADERRYWSGLPRVARARGAAMAFCASDEAGDPAAMSFADPPGGHILLSSGTTGGYKMVLMDPSIETTLIANRIRITELTEGSIVKIYRYGPWTRAGYQAPLAAFVLGATVVIELEEMARALLYPGLTHAIILPSMTNALVAAMPEGAPPLSGVRMISVGGPMTQAQAGAIRTRVSPRLYNGLAATETNTIGDTPIETPDDLRWHRLVPGFEVQVVDDEDRPAPVGEVGRLRISTKDAPKAYLNDDAATLAHFKDGYFYTGDLAVFREDGRLALQGRVTEVLIIGGVKVSPAPIEQRLKEALPVDGVCLFSMPNAVGAEELHLILETTKPIEPALLTSVLQRELWGFPQVRVHFTATLPRNDMGKVVRRTAQAEAMARLGSG